VLKAVAALLRDARRGLDPSIAQGHNPFPIWAAPRPVRSMPPRLACRADHFQEAVAQMVHIWENFRAEQVYRSDLIGVVRTGRALVDADVDRLAGATVAADPAQIAAG